ncbi:hypothetical protein [Hyphomonas sp.]|uniref:hypothetical protein n=1 Tax=Hyphomonas sp. TaxID=87 RepID=UPI00300224FD
MTVDELAKIEALLSRARSGVLDGENFSVSMARQQASDAFAPLIYDGHQPEIPEQMIAHIRELRAKLGMENPQ